MQTNIKKINGNWDKGYALDKHVLSSRYLGDNEYGHPQFDTTRSEVGEALYQLKYKKDTTQALPLAKEIATKIYPHLKDIGLIIPAPASKSRAIQPVSLIANHLAKIVGINSFDNILKKAPGKIQLKNIQAREEKVAALENLITFSDGISGQGKWNALVVDDVFDTGATLEAICEALQGYEKINKIYVATITWK